MHKLSSFEITLGCVMLVIVCAIIVALIAIGFKIASDAKAEEIEESVNRRADRLARKMMRDRLDGIQIRVLQRIVITEDDLKGGMKDAV